MKTMHRDIVGGFLLSNDSEQLFHNMLFYNPYYPNMKKQLEDALEKTKQKLDEIEAEQTDARLFRQE